MDRERTAARLSRISRGAMIVLSLTQLVPSLQLAGNAVWVGLASFFLVEGLTGTSGSDSGLRFRGLGRELKESTFWRQTALLAGVQILNVIVGVLLFGSSYVDYDLGRALDVIHSDSLLKLLALMPLSAWGEEIAWRGFFLGKRPEQIPFWPWAVFSSLLFAMGHVSQHAVALVLFGTSGNFICSLLLCRIYQQRENCMTSTIAHLLGNYAEILFILLVFGQA